MTAVVTLGLVAILCSEVQPHFRYVSTEQLPAAYSMQSSTGLGSVGTQHVDYHLPSTWMSIANQALKLLLTVFWLSCRRRWWSAGSAALASPMPLCCVVDVSRGSPFSQRLSFGRGRFRYCTLASTSTTGRNVRPSNILQNVWKSSLRHLLVGQVPTITWPKYISNALKFKTLAHFVSRIVKKILFLRTKV